MWFGVCVSKRAGERAAGAELGPGSAPGTAGDERDQSRHGRSLVLPSSAGFIGQPSPITLICGIKEKSISIREVMCGGFTGLVGHGATGAAWALPVPVPVPGSVTGARLAVQEEALEMWRSPLPEHYFFRNNHFCLPRLEEARLGSLPGVAQVVVGVRWWLGALRGRRCRGWHRNSGWGWGADGCQGFCCDL